MTHRVYLRYPDQRVAHKTQTDSREVAGLKEEKRKMKLTQVNSAMSEYNGSVAYGSECNAWQDFVDDCHQQYGMAPWDDRAADTEVSAEFAGYWLDVADGKSDDYDQSGGLVGA